MLQEKLGALKRKLEKEQMVRLALPIKFSFKDHDVLDFERFLSFFNWSLHDVPVQIDLTTCQSANYQALSLLVLYAWKLRSQDCKVSFKIEDKSDIGASFMWINMGARGLFYILTNPTQQFHGNKFKPLFAVRSANDFKVVIESAESFTNGFNVEYENTFRYIIGELLYNTLEHGKVFGGQSLKDIRIPSIVQFTWYRKTNEIHFIIADVGIGIKKHIEQAYPGQESDEDAIKLALKPKISGTFGANDPYKNKNNAGMGLYISSNIIRRLNADMHVMSGNALLHISPRDVTGRTLATEWPGAFVHITIRLENNPAFILHKIMQEFRDAANTEQVTADHSEESTRFYVGINNHFGRYAEDKDAAIKFRDRRLFKAIEGGLVITIDFDDVVSSPHSFLSALLASPIESLVCKPTSESKLSMRHRR
ncbi:MAG: ATP-binding protein [Sulfuricellaceae bacterium]